MAPPFDLKKAMGLGTDTIDPSVLGLPFLQIIQKGSPEFDESHKDYAKKRIPGCKPGDVFATQGRKLLTQPLPVIAIATTTIYTEWKPRAQGGGFIGNRPLSVTSDKAYRKGAANTPDKNKEWLGENELKFTVFFSLRYLDGTAWKKGLISFTSTGLKRARKWTRDLVSLRYPGNLDQTPPIFAAQWKLSTENDSNDLGGWKAWNIEFDRLLSPETDAQLLEESFTAYSVEAPRLQAGAPLAALPEGDKDVPY